MTTPAFQKAVHERAALLVSAQRVLGEGFRCDGLADRAIHEAVLRKVYGKEFDSTGKSDSYLAGACAHAIKSSAPRADDSASTPQKRVELPRADSQHVPAWMRPLSVTRRSTLERADGTALPPWRQPLRFSKRASGGPDDAA